MVGLWHFFVPWMFRWRDYLPAEHENLTVAIDWVNGCFSLLLFGLSVLLTVMGKRALEPNKEVVSFYVLLTVVWVFRACLAAFAEPWSLEPVLAAAVGQLAASVLIAVMMVFVSVLLIREVLKLKQR